MVSSTRCGLGVDVGCHATSKDVELSYNLGYFITAVQFCPVHLVCPARRVCTICPDIIRILWISTFCGHYPHFVDTSTFHGYISISRISWIYLHFSDIICIGCITS